MINIYQFLKQGTSLSKHAHNTNNHLAQTIIPSALQPNHTYQHTGKFHLSDSEEEETPQTNHEHELNAFHQQKTKQNKMLLKKKKIKVTGLDAPMAVSNFTKLIKKYSIKAEIVAGLCELGFERPTDVQMQVIPALFEGRNIIVTAPTGTGKTLAFLLPLLSQIELNHKIQAVIMAPSQELAAQITEVINKLAKHTAITYQSTNNLQAEQLKRIQQKKSPKINVVVATPLTFLKIFQGRKFLLKHVKYVVLDECDKCFQQSFFQQINNFLQLFNQFTPNYALFSATIQHPVEQILNQYLHESLRIEVGGRNRVLSKINQSIEYCTNELGKLVYLKNLIMEGNFVPPVLVFVQERQRTKQLFFELQKYFKQEMQETKRVEVLTSDKPKEERKRILEQFDSGKYWILITTDIVSRGIDFHNVNLVINYDFPNSILNYIHRVGRTGRAHKIGTAVTFFTDQDKPLVRSLANLLKVSGCEVPQWICEMPKIDRKEKRKLQKYPVRRLSVGRANGVDKQWSRELQVLEKRWSKLRKGEKLKQVEDEGWTTVKSQ